VQDALEQHKFEAPTAPSRIQPEGQDPEAEAIAIKTHSQNPKGKDLKSLRVKN
jgi:hypothetical protein